MRYLLSGLFGVIGLLVIGYKASPGVAVGIFLVVFSVELTRELLSEHKNHD